MSAPARRTLVPVAALAIGVASAAVLLHNQAPTTYAAASNWLATLDLLAGLGLLAAGTWVCVSRPDALGPATLALGIVWFAPDVIGWDHGPALARSVALVAAPFALPLLAATVLDNRRATIWLIALTGVYAVLRAAVRDPFYDLHCWDDCTINVFLLHRAPQLARDLDFAWFGASAAAWVALGATAALGAHRSRRRRPVATPAVLVAAASAAYAVARVVEPAERAGRDGFDALFVARAVAFAALAAGVAWTVVRERRARTEVARLAADLGAAPEPGALGAALAGSLGDPELTIAFWSDHARRYVDTNGRPADDGPGIPVVRGGEPVALVRHGGALRSDTIDREVGPAARLAIDNERLRAETLAQLVELQTSSARIVAAADDARRRIERDLHDGAQQRLLALGLELRLAQTAAGPDAQATLDAARDAAATALDELRELASGIHPAILSGSGLAAALESAADTAPVPLTVLEVPDARLPAAVERAAYALVTDAAASATDELVVRVTADEGRAVIRVSPRPDGSPSAVDRVLALGGRVNGDDDALEVSIPCA